MQMKKRIFIINLLILFLLAGIYLLYLFHTCPQITISQEELYGENNQNLKDFEIFNDGLYSTSGDPWIEYHLEEPICVKLLEIECSGIEIAGLSSEIFNTDTWESETYILKNGTMKISYDNVTMQNLRFDLVETDAVYLEVKQVVFNSKNGIIFYVLKQCILVLILLITLECLIFQAQEITAGNKLVKKMMPILGLTGILLCAYNIYYLKVNQTLRTWMYLVITANLLLMLIGSEIFNKRHLFLESTYILLYAIVDFGLIEIMSGIEYNFKNLNAGLWNLCLWVFAMIIFHLIFGSIKYAVMIPNVLAMLLGVVNHYFYQFRGNPFQLSDLQMAGTALTVIGNYSFQPDHTLLFCIVAEIMAVCAWCLYDKESQRDKKQVQSEVVLCLLLFTGIFLNKPGVSYWNMKATSQQYGYLNSFVEYARRELSHSQPDGYSLTKVENILNRYDSTVVADEDKSPNIIVIMNEAFSDLPAIYEFETEQDGMPFIHGLKENTIKGNMLVSVFGGTTVNTEYEFLSGNTMAFFNGGSNPYMQYVKKEQESITWELKELGYQTLAFHPCNATNYNRNKVYPLLGFDSFTAIEDDLLYTDKLRSYISDKADFENIIAMYEQRNEDLPFYMFNVTMQNHGGYSQVDSQVEETVVPKDENLRYTQLLEYLSLIKETDAAFEELVNYFSNIDDDTIILMFGDHQPGLDMEIYYAMDEKLAASDVTLAERMKMYTVPFVMWANYDIGSEENVLTSPNFLRVKLMEKTGLPLSQYDQFLLECSKSYPAINFMGYFDTDRNLYSVDFIENVEILKEYEVLQYANVYNKSAWKKLSN